MAAVLPSSLVFLSSIPPVTRTFTALTVVGSIIYSWRWNAVPGGMPYLTLEPGSSFFYPWTFITSVFVETSLFEFIGSIIFVTPSLRYLERLWGAVETIKFIVVSVLLSNVIAVAFNWIEFYGTGSETFLYGMQYHGQMSLQIAILVAMTQIIPEHQVQLLGVIKARVKGLPMAYLTVSTVMTFIGYQCPWIVIQFGWFVSYIYLRFYKKNSADVVGGGDSYGDRSETFAFVNWFPPFIHGPISLLANFAHANATRFHLIPTSGADVEGGLYNQAPGTARAEAERRRAMALRALDQRLANTTAPPLSANTLESTAPRPPPAAAASKADGIMPSNSQHATDLKTTQSVDLDHSTP